MCYQINLGCWEGLFCCPSRNQGLLLTLLCGFYGPDWSQRLRIKILEDDQLVFYYFYKTSNLSVTQKEESIKNLDEWFHGWQHLPDLILLMGVGLLSHAMKPLCELYEYALKINLLYKYAPSKIKMLIPASTMPLEQNTMN